MKAPISFILPAFCLLFNVLFAQKPMRPGADTVFYDWMNKEKVVGQEWSVRNGRNDYYYHDEYNDRGRGPSTLSHLRTDEKGNIIAEENVGVDYYKSPVDEHYAVYNGKAHWKNRFENDSADYHNELYSDIGGPDAEYTLILRRLQLSPSMEVKVLPAGVRKFKVITTTNIYRPGSRNKLALQLVAFSGYGAGPNYLWFTSQGEFFGDLNPWSSLIRRGFASHVEELYRIQKSFASDYYRQLAIALTGRPAAGFAITNTTVFDPVTGQAATGKTVVARGEKIEKVGNATDVVVPTGYQVIDGTSKFLMPGLWDMHQHYAKESGPFLLAQGVTNIRDMGNGPELLEIRRMTNDDSLLGPDISYISGFIDKEGPLAAPTGVLVKSLNEALEAIQNYKDKGYDQIKIYSSIEPAWVKPMADKAHQLGMRVAGHIPAFMTASEAVDAGYDEVTHANMLFLNFFGDTVDTRGMARLTLPGRKGYAIDVKGDSVQKFIRQLQAHHTVVDPTLSVEETIFIDLPGQLAHQVRPIAAYLPAEIRRSSMNGSYLDNDSLIDTYARSFANMKRMVKELIDDSIIVLAGTDNQFLQHELEIYSDAGISNATVLKMATWWPALISGKAQLFGTIEVGKQANMILVDGDPLKRMEDIRKIYLTIKDGKLYWPKDIYKSFGWGYYY